MTLPAGLFSYRTTARRDVNVVFEPSGREVVRMPETVLRFGCIFADETGWCVTIVANSHSTMAGLQPTIKLVLHNVTIHTRFSVVSHVGISASVNEGVGAHTYRHSDRDAEYHSARKCPLTHLRTFSVCSGLQVNTLTGALDVHSPRSTKGLCTKSGFYNDLSLLCGLCVSL